MKHDAISTENGVQGIPAHLMGFALMHSAMRRDARRLTAAAGKLGPANRQAVASWWTVVRNAIDWHHESEDRVLWPGLRQHVRGFEAQESSIDGDHEILEQTMEQVSAVLAEAGRLEELADAADRFRQTLYEHLAAEESFIFPVFLNDLLPSQYLALERQVIDTAPARVMSYLQPWMFDGADRRAVSSVSATIPPPVRLLGETVLRWRYKRLVDPVLALF